MVTYNPVNNTWNPTVTPTYPSPPTVTGVRNRRIITPVVSDNKHINYMGVTYEILPGNIAHTDVKKKTPYYVEAPGTASHGMIFKMSDYAYPWTNGVSGSVQALDGGPRASRTLDPRKLRKLKQIAVVPVEPPAFAVGAKVLIDRPNSAHHGMVGKVTDMRMPRYGNKTLYYVTFDNGHVRSYYSEALRKASEPVAVPSLRNLQVDIHATNVRNGFASIYRTPGDLIALMHSELSEALEEFRVNTDVTRIYYNKDAPTKPEGFMVELADCVIRILDCAESYNVDLMPIIKLKHEYNKTRSYRHGDKKL